MNVDLTNKIVSWYGVISTGLLTCYSLPSQPEPRSKWYYVAFYLVVAHLDNAGTCLDLQPAYDQKVQWHQGGRISCNTHYGLITVKMAFVTLATYPSFLSKSLTWNFPKVQWHMHGWLVVGAFYSPKLEDRILDRKPDWPVSLWPCVLLSGQRARLASVIMTLCTAAWSEKGTCIYFVIDRLWQWCPAVVINCIRSGNMGTSTHIHTCIPPTHICTHTCHTHTCHTHTHTRHTHTHTYVTHTHTHTHTHTFTHAHNAHTYTHRYHTYIQEVWQFLGVSLPSEAEIKLTHKNANTWISSSKYKDSFHMDSKTRQMLTEFFKPYNLRLARLLNDTRFLWKEWTSASASLTLWREICSCLYFRYSSFNFQCVIVFKLQWVILFNWNE